MPAPVALTAQLAEESRATQRQYVLASARARWTLLGLGVALLMALRLARLVPVSWWLIIGFAALFAAANYAMYRIARDTPFRPGYAHISIAIGSGVISTLLYALGPSGHVLYVAYLIAPLEAAWYLGSTEAWQAVALNLTGFGLATALRAAVGDWSWSLFLQEALGLAFACVVLVPLLTRLASRLRATGEALAQGEAGDRLAARRPRPGGGAADQRGGAAGPPSRRRDRARQRAAGQPGRPSGPGIARGRDPGTGIPRGREAGRHHRAHREPDRSARLERRHRGRPRRTARSGFPRRGGRGAEVVRAELPLSRGGARASAPDPGADHPGGGGDGRGAAHRSGRGRRLDRRAAGARCGPRRRESDRAVRHRVRRGDRRAGAPHARRGTTDGRGGRHRRLGRPGRGADLGGDRAADRVAGRADDHLPAPLRRRGPAHRDDAALQRQRFGYGSGSLRPTRTA